MEFSSFKNPIGIPTTTSVTMSEASRRLTPLSRWYKARATKIKPAWPTSCAAMPRRKSVSKAAMLLAVSVSVDHQLAGHIFDGEEAGYSREYIQQACESAWVAGGTHGPSLVVRAYCEGLTGDMATAVKMFLHPSKMRLLWALGEWFLPFALRVKTIASD